MCYQVDVITLGTTKPLSLLANLNSLLITTPEVNVEEGSMIAGLCLVRVTTQRQRQA